MMLDILDINNNQRLGNGKDGPHISVGASHVGLGNTNPSATQSPTLGASAVLPSYREVIPVDLAVWSAQGGMIADAKILPRANALKPPGQIVLFQKIMKDWGFNDQEAATLLGFVSASDIGEIYRGTRPVGHRDANDRLRAVLRVATDLDALYGETRAVRDWLSEPQHDLEGSTPRTLLTEGSMENLLRIKYYVAYLSGR
jgi:hypothetical protein